MKFIDNGYKRQLRSVRSNDIIQLFAKSVNPIRFNFGGLFLFDYGVFNIICNAIYYKSINVFILELITQIRRYWKIDGLHPVVDASNPHILNYRRADRWRWRDMIFDHLHNIFTLYNQYFDNRQILENMSELVMWIRK